MLNPAKFDRLVTIQSRRELRGDAGGVTIQWENEVTAAAEKVSLDSREAQRAGATREGIDLVLRLRYRPTLTTRHRLEFEGRPYDIVGLIEEGRRESLLVTASHIEEATL